MDTKYEKSMKVENDIYKGMQDNLTVPKGISTGWKQLDKALDWLCDETESVLDFGCGNGSLLFFCANRGTKKHIGIDLSVEGIKCAEERSKMMNTGEYTFHTGSLDRLEKLKDESVDAIILSNIIDNMYPDDARNVLAECKRILAVKGKLFIKLNPYITSEQVKEWDLKKIEQDVYDDGLILWNRTTQAWESELSDQFEIIENYEFCITEADQKNRVFLLSKIHCNNEDCLFKINQVC